MGLKEGCGMTKFWGFSAVPSWFVVLPDCVPVQPVGAALCGVATREVSHVSGRPWLVGCWPESSVTIGQAGSIKIVMFGQHAVTDSELAHAAERVRTVTDIDQMAASSVGSSHLIASVAGQVRVQGTVTGVRGVFYAGIGGVTVAADRADVLARLLGSGIDEQRLAVHLLMPPILYPLTEQPVWRGVTVLPGDHYLLLGADGRHRSVRWWNPPEPVVPLAEGAAALRKALSDAVAVRVQGHELASCDLGGVDSTAVCCVAAQGETKIVAYTAASPDPLADDAYWAERTVASLGNVEHHVIPAAEMPLVYDGLLDTDELLDEPCGAAVDCNRWLIIARRAAARGSHLHLTGFGGDELLYGSVAHLHSLLRTAPLVAVRPLWGFATKYRWSRWQMLTQLMDTSPYPAWLRRVADNLTESPSPLEEPLLDWGFHPRLPPWMTMDTVDTVRDVIRAEASSAEPLSGRRGQHRELETMRSISRVTRQFEQMSARMGVTLGAPYYDDRVIEAGLAVRSQDRITPWRYKPLITEAMGGIVPDTSLARQTKANGTGDEDPGLRKHREDLLTLWEDSRLDRQGLINAVALRELCTRPLPPHLQIGALYQTVACEVWLRSLENLSVPSLKRSG
jgi:asparagine synthase (glutamine-hydrolysing)